MMTLLRDHPRFPYGMARDLQHVIGDEVTTTLAAYPERRAYGTIEHAITAYAEQLEPFSREEIQLGFRAARVQATVDAPTPSQVRVCVAAVWRARQELPHDAELFVLGEFPEELRAFYRHQLDAPPQHAGAEER